MVKKTTNKKAKSSKARTTKSKAKVKPKTKSKTKSKPKAKVKVKSKAKSSKSAKKVVKKKSVKKRVTKAKTTRAKRTSSSKPSAKGKVKWRLSTGAGAKLAGKLGSAIPASKEVPNKKTKRKGLALGPKELGEFRDLLLHRRKELLGNVSRMREEALNKNRQDAAGNLSKFPTNPADLGSDNYELEFTLSMLEGERVLLKEIDEALNRISQGTYGVCEGTGEIIDRDRLLFEPWARYTVEYAGLLEKGLVTVEANGSEEE